MILSSDSTMKLPHSVGKMTFLAMDASAYTEKFKQQKTTETFHFGGFTLAEKEGLGLACGLGPGSALTCHWHVIHSLAASNPSFRK